MGLDSKRGDFLKWCSSLRAQLATQPWERSQSLRASRVALGTKPLCAVLSKCYTGLGMADGAPCVACTGLSNSKPPETVLPKSPTFSAPAESGV